jgi:hypothetical protein
MPPCPARAFIGGDIGEMKMLNETETKLPARLEDIADVMLAETASSNPLLRFKKGEFLIGDDEVEVGHEYVAYPFDAMRGFVQWKDDAVVEHRLGRIRDAFTLEREDLPDDEDWKPQYVLPLEDAETGEFVAFVSGSFGGKRAINNLINTTAHAVKAGRGEATPLIRLAVGSFTSKEYGRIACPSFEVVNQQPQEVKPIEDEMSDKIPF